MGESKDAQSGQSQDQYIQSIIDQLDQVLSRLQ